MVSKRCRLMALVLAVMTLLSVMAVGTFSSSAAAGDTVYCENAAGWGSVYCYMWKDGAGENQGWPGVQMTKGDGNLWSYSVSGDWDMIIFNGGEGQPQTDNLSYQGNGSCYNNSTKQWTTIDTPDNPVVPDTPVAPDNPVTPDKPVTPSGGNVVYFRNTANWSKVNVYMWTDGAGENQSWPGVAATNIGDGVWMYEATKDWKMVIFNDGSTQTDNLEYKGSEYIYDYGKSAWELYDTSKLHLKSFTADVESPQYTGVKINFSAVAGGGEGDLSYQFSVGSTVISEFSSSSKASWTPATAGTYTVKVDVKDTLGETVSKSMNFEIKDIKSEVKPVIQNVEVTPSNFEGTELKKGAEATVDVTAGGGNTGTKLLFYKYTITDPAGKTANVPYYTLKNQYKFTPNTLGTYSVTATVEGSDNSFTAKTVEYDCVSELSKPGDLSASLTVKDAGSGKYTATVTAAGGTAPYTYEFKLNGEVKQAASDKATFTFDASADGSYKVEVTVKDAAGKTVTKSDTIQVGGVEQPTDPVVPGPTDPEVDEVKATLAVEDKGEGIFKFTASATGGDGNFQYQFSANGSVVKDFSASNTVTLNLSADGTYTIKVTVKDSAGSTAEATKVLTVSGGKVEMPLEATISIAESGEYLKATATAIGGDGNYQYEFSIDGTVYQAYSAKDNFTFGFDKSIFGVYDIKVNVKDGAGATVSSTMQAWTENGEYGYGEWARPEEGDPTNPTTKPTEPAGDYLKGDADCDGKVNVKDATLIQKHVAKIVEMNAQAQKNADVDDNGTINIKDATNIQKFVANLIKW